jgi:phosphoglycerol transferase MdoB-like AlkP superfamily enzyme
MPPNSRPLLPRLPLLIGLVMLLFWTLLRAGLIFYTGLDQVPLSLWPRIFAYGLWFDIAVASIFLAPVCIYEALLPDRWRRSRWHAVLRFVWLLLSLTALLFGLVSEITFWLEFSTRFNFIAVDYLIYTQEVIGNIRQSYPVGLILAAIAMLALVIAATLRAAIARADRHGLAPRQRLALLVVGLLLPVALLSAANVDQMDGSGNNYADELSGNGLFGLAAAMRRNELDYDKFYQTIAQEQADTILAGLNVRRLPLKAAMQAQPDDAADDQTPFKSRPRNVVLISVESLSASYVGAYGATTGLTPELDRLAAGGLMFDRVFATGTRTVRGLEALSLGTPPVPGQAIVRRPNNEQLSTVGGVLGRQGYAPYFIYGGYGYFDNMNAYFAGNNYKVIDRTDFPKQSGQFENIWGVADEVLFDQTLKTLDAEHGRNKPFFVQVLTTSNHRPYTYPDGRIDIKSPGGREGAVKYTDYAIGKFIRDASTKPWFNETLFVIVADHCASVAGKSKLPVERYHIPLVFYAPALLKPGHYRQLVSQIDIVPTLIEVLGKKGDDHFFGQSFFDRKAALGRAFISNYQELGYLRRDILTVLMTRQRVASFHIDPVSYAATPAPNDPALVAEAISYYQTASKAFKSGALRDRLLAPP